MKSPWLVEDLQDVCPGCQTCSAADRLQMVKESTDRAWLIQVINWRDSQKTVIEAAGRRLRRLTKQEAA